jgi:hypothetical protein
LYKRRTFFRLRSSFFQTQSKLPIERATYARRASGDVRPIWPSRVL